MDPEPVGGLVLPENSGSLGYSWDKMEDPLLRGSVLWYRGPVGQLGCWRNSQAR